MMEMRGEQDRDLTSLVTELSVLTDPATDVETHILKPRAHLPVLQGHAVHLHHSLCDTTSHIDLDWAVNEQWEDSLERKKKK